MFYKSHTSFGAVAKSMTIQEESTNLYAQTNRSFHLSDRLGNICNFGSHAEFSQ